MVDYCERIQCNLERFGCSFEQFEDDFMFQDACCMCVIQIGELAGQLSDEIKSQSPSVPWRIIKVPLKRIDLRRLIFQNPLRITEGGFVVNDALT